MVRKEYATFSDFYVFYLSEHRNQTCRRLHFVGTLLALSLIVSSVVTGTWQLLLGALVAGYAFAWVGHFFFEKNRPATFSYPLRSFAGDWRMFFDIATGKLKF